jgi:hypothetical protein
MAHIFERKFKTLKELMKTSRTTRFAIALLAVLLPASVQRASAQALTIQSASTNANQTALTIAGSNYCASPTVTLNGISLLVTGATASQITATLPAMASGTYYLIVSCGTLAGKTVYFDVTLGVGNGGTSTRAAAGCWVNGQRYADCGNGTVTDSVTGLIWLKDAACTALGVTDFATANAEAAALHSGQCSLTDGSAAGDWRLPTRSEWLATLQGPQGLIAQYLNNCPAPQLKANDGVTCFSSSEQGSAAGQHAFLNVVAGGYWSSSTYELAPTYAYLANLGAATVGSVGNPGNIVFDYQINGLTLNVWPVRGGSK